MGFTFIKRNAQTGAGVSGATFTLFRRGVAFATAVSDASGLVTFDGLRPGPYTLQETGTPPGFEPNSALFTVVLTECGATIDGVPAESFVVNNTPVQISASFTATKTSSATGLPVQGAVFSLSSSFGIIVGTATSDASGALTFSGLAAGSYSLFETAAAPGFEVNPATFSVVIDASGNVTINGMPANGFVIQNTPAAASFTAIKINEMTGAPVPGATFSLSSSFGILVGTATSDANGALPFSGLAAGSYTLVETQAAPGFVRNMAMFAMVVDASGHVTINGSPANGFQILNTPIGTAFAFTKINSFTGAPLAGAVFELLNSDGIAAATATSDVNGLVSFSHIPSGTYSMIETAPPPQFSPNTSIFMVSVGVFGNVTIDGVPASGFTVPNVPLLLGNLTFAKTNDATGARLAGATFVLMSGGVVVATAVSDMNGIVSFTNMPAGAYELAETIAPAGFNPNPMMFNANIAQSGSTINGMPDTSVSISNEPIVSQGFTFTKVDSATGIGLAGAVFTLTGSGTIPMVATSGADGSVTFIGVPFGTFTMTEITAPPGFTPDMTTFSVAVSQGGLVTINGVPAQAFQATNTAAAPQGFTFAKVDSATNIGLAGATFQLTSGGVITATATSDANGSVTFTGIAPGTYTMLETVAPAGFVPDATEFSVSVTANNQAVINGIPAQAFQATNTAVTSQGFTFAKVDSATGIGLAGATFELISGGTVFGTAMSDAGGIVTFTDITPGTYTMFETIAPIGFAPDIGQFSVVMGADGQATINGMPAGTFIASNTAIP